MPKKRKPDVSASAIRSNGDEMTFSTDQDYGTFSLPMDSEAAEDTASHVTLGDYVLALMARPFSDLE